jgi:hypothetical protein
MENAQLVNTVQAKYGFNKHQVLQIIVLHFLLMTGVSMRHDITKLIVILLGLGINFAHASEGDKGTPLFSLIQPGFYGLVDIGNGPPPPVVYAQPILIASSSASDHAAPIYLHVPPNHAKDWSKFCHKYNACNQPVYFVRSGEYVRDKHYSSQEHEHDYENYRYVNQSGNKKI